MKKGLLLICIAIVSITNPFVAQELAGAKNVVKINLFALATRDVSLQFEHAFTKNISVALHAGFIPTGKLPAPIDAQVPKDIKNLIFSGYNLTPEFRFYPGKKAEKEAPHGFYIGAYARYSNYSATGSFTYNDSTNYPVYVTEKNVHGAFKFTGFGGGLQFGYQWIIKRNLSIDWWILGFHGGGSTATATIDAENSQNAQDIKKEFDKIDVSIPGATISSSVTGNQVNVNATFPFIGLRSGLCIGLAF